MSKIDLLKKFFKDFNLKIDAFDNKIYFNQTKKINSFDSILFYLLDYKIIEVGEYQKYNNAISIYKDNISSIEYLPKVKRFKIELYK